MFSRGFYASIIRFIEDYWLHGQRIAGSFDALANSIDGMLDFGADDHRWFFDHKNRCDLTDFLFLDESTGQPIKFAGR